MPSTRAFADEAPEGAPIEIPVGPYDQHSPFGGPMTNDSGHPVDCREVVIPLENGKFSKEIQCKGDFESLKKVGKKSVWGKIVNFVFEIPEELKKFWTNTVKKAKLPVPVKVKYNLPSSSNGAAEIALEVKTETEPSYIRDHYSKKDSYRLSGSGSLFSPDIPIALSASANNELMYVRQMPCPPEESVTACRLGQIFTEVPKVSLPFWASVAREMSYTDFFTFTTATTLASSAPIFGIPGFGVGASVALSGQFTFQVFREQRNYIRLKVFSVHSDTKSIGGSSTFDIKVTPIARVNSLLNRTAFRKIDRNPLNFGGSASRSFVVMYDYLLDLSDRAVADAYDTVMSPSSLIFEKPIEAVPIKTASKYEAILAREMIPLEELADRDQGKPNWMKSVRRMFVGDSVTETTQSFLKFNINLLRYDWNDIRSVFCVQRKDQYQEQGPNLAPVKVPQKFLIYSDINLEGLGFVFGYWGDKSDSNISMLFTADDNCNPVSFEALNMKDRITYKSFNPKDYQKILDMNRRDLHPEIFRRIDWAQKQWTFPDDKYVNATFDRDIIFQKESLGLVRGGGALRTVPREDMLARMFELIKDYLKHSGHGRPKSEKHVQVTENCHLQEIHLCYEEDANLAVDLVRFALGLQVPSDYTPKPKKMPNPYRPFNSDEAPKFEDIYLVPSQATAENRFLAFRKALNIEIFRAVVTPFLYSFLPDANTLDTTGIALSLNASDSPSINVSFGQKDQSDIYKAAQEQGALIRNTGFDIRNFVSPADLLNPHLTSHRKEPVGIYDDITHNAHTTFPKDSDGNLQKKPKSK